MRNLTIYTDGGSRGNPGPAAGAFVILDEHNKQIFAGAKFLTKATNNIAEYTGLVASLEKAVSLKAENIKIFSDSELMVKQLNGQYKVKNEGLRELFCDANELLENFKDWKITHVRREKNEKADELANRCIDARKNIEQTAAPSTGDKKTKHIKIGILLSSGGRTMLNILDQIKQGKLDAEISAVISSRSDVAGVDKAKAAGLPVEIIRKKDYPDIEEFSGKIKKNLIAAKVDLVVQAGWLCLWNIPAEFENRVMNIHPALLPAFGGQGMWGHHVHEAVLKAGCKISGCTVHFCTNEYDKGPIIVQKTCPVLENDDPDTLAARVFQQECIAYPEAIKLFSQSRIVIQNNKTIIK